MRALTVRQPWASLIMAGVKPVENRTWPVPETVALFVRGCSYVPDGTGWYVASDLHLSIHAAQKIDWTAMGRVPHVRPDEMWWGEYADLPTGALLGYVTVTGCHHADVCDYIDERDGYEGPCSLWAEPNAYHWTLADPKPLDDPVPMRGRQGLWTVPDDVLAGVPA